MCVKLRVLFPPDYSAPGSGAVNDASGNPYWEVLIKPAHKMLGYIREIMLWEGVENIKRVPFSFWGRKTSVNGFYKRKQPITSPHAPPFKIWWVLTVGLQSDYKAKRKMVSWNKWLQKST